MFRSITINVYFMLHKDALISFCKSCIQFNQTALICYFMNIHKDNVNRKKLEDA